MVSYRDIKLKQKDKLDDKQDRLLFKRAVLTTEGGLQTSTDPFNDVWANSTLRRVFYMAEGAVQPAQILCRKISDPYVGLGVIIGYADGSNQLEVLSDDFFLTKTGDPTGWASTSPRDFEPGGRKQMWVYTKVITPLATYPGSGVAVNVILGDYPYLGTRKSFAGSVNYDLSASVPGGGLCRYAGLYLDASNTLQVVNGATIAAGSTPAEPSWPAGAFRLCVVLLTNGDTSIDFANIIDRRMAWSDEEAGTASSWPFAHVLTVSSTDADADYPDIDSAIAGAAAGSIILIDAETFSLATTITINKALTLMAWDRGIFTGSQTLITSSVVGPTIDITSTGVILIGLVVRNTGSGGTQGVIRTNNSFIAINCEFVKSAGNPGGGGFTYGVYQTAGQATQVLDTECTCVTNGTADYAWRNDTGIGGCVFIRGKLNGGTKDIYSDQASATFRFADVIIGSNVIDIAGTYTGVYFDGFYNQHFAPTTGRNSGVWLVDESALLKKKELTLATAVAASANGDTIKLETDTYTITATQSIATSITIEGDGPEATIIDFTGSNQTAFDLTTDSTTITFRNLTVKHTGGGTAATGIFSNNTVNFILDNAQVLIPSGAGTDSRPLWVEAGTWELRNGAKAKSTSGTNKYGIYNDVGAATITIGAGCEVGGATQDIYGDQAGSTITLEEAILTNNLVSWTGTIIGQYQAGSTGLFELDNKGVEAYHNANQSINDGTDTSLALNSERRDDAGFHDTSTNNSRLTVPTGYAGWYQISGNVQFASNATGLRQTAIMLNGTTYLAVNLQPAVNGAVTIVAVSTMYYLNAADYVELRAYQSSGGGLNVETAGNYSPELRMVRM